MRPSPSQLSSASTTLPPRRRRNRRRSPPSHSEDEEEESYSPTNSYLYENDGVEEALQDYESSNINGARPNTYTGSLSSAVYSTTAVQNYVNVAPLPIFHGDPSECPVAHLIRFERVCRANNVTDIDTVIRIFPVTLDNEAAMWYELAIEPYPDMSWDDIKNEFLQAYRPPDFADRARAELIGLRQKEGEGVNSYHLRMRWILKRWPDHGIPEKVLKGIFVDGLREDFQDWIVPQRPETLEEVVKLALGWEQAQSARVARQRSMICPEIKAVKCGFCEGSHEESACIVRKKIRELWLESFKDEGCAGRNGAQEQTAMMESAPKTEGEKEKEGVTLGRLVSMGKDLNASVTSISVGRNWTAALLFLQQIPVLVLQINAKIN